MSSSGSRWFLCSRDWFCLILRLFGIWLLIQAVEEVVPYLLFALDSLVGSGMGAAYLAGVLVWWVGRTLFGLALLVFAPAIATRWYPSEKQSQVDLTVTSVAAEGPHAWKPNETKSLRIGMQLLGVYALLLAVQSVSLVVAGYLSGGGFNTFRATGLGIDSGPTQAIVNVGLHLAFAAILILRNDQLLILLEKFRSPNDPVDQEQ